MTNRGFVTSSIVGEAITNEYSHMLFEGHRATLSAAMSYPIMRNLNYSGVAREMFTVEPMPHGAYIIYSDIAGDDYEESFDGAEDFSDG